MNEPEKINGLIQRQTQARETKWEEIKQGEDCKWHYQKALYRIVGFNSSHPTHHFWKFQIQRIQGSRRPVHQRQWWESSWSLCLHPPEPQTYTEGSALHCCHTPAAGPGLEPSETHGCGCGKRSPGKKSIHDVSIKIQNKKLQLTLISKVCVWYYNKINIEVAMEVCYIYSLCSNNYADKQMRNRETAVTVL